MNIPCSTKEHRNIQRVNAAAEVLNSTIDNFSDVGGIPLKISQTFLGAYGFFNRNLKTNERVLNGLQSFVAISHVACLAALSLSDENCNDGQQIFCQLALFSQLAYKGLIITSWAASEAKKEPRNEPQPQD